jgi:hypothetical protein
MLGVLLQSRIEEHYPRWPQGPRSLQPGCAGTSSWEGPRDGRSRMLALSRHKNPAGPPACGPPRAPAQPAQANRLRRCPVYDPINIRYATDTSNMQIYALQNPDAGPHATGDAFLRRRDASVCAEARPAPRSWNRILFRAISWQVTRMRGRGRQRRGARKNQTNLEDAAFSMSQAFSWGAEPRVSSWLSGCPRMCGCGRQSTRIAEKNEKRTQTHRAFSMAWLFQERKASILAVARTAACRSAAKPRRRALSPPLYASEIQSWPSATRHGKTWSGARFFEMSPRNSKSCAVPSSLSSGHQLRISPVCRS